MMQTLYLGDMKLGWQLSNLDCSQSDKLGQMGTTPLWCSLVGLEDLRQIKSPGDMKASILAHPHGCKDSGLHIGITDIKGKQGL